MDHDISANDVHNDLMLECSTDSIAQHVADHSTPIVTKKRRGRGQTPIVDDEIRRSSRFRRGTKMDRIHLENEPRKKKGATRKSATISLVVDLKKTIVSKSLEESLAEFEVAPIPTPALVDLGKSFYGVPPTELSLDTLHTKPNVNQ
jgi:hypothetical protein